MSTIYQLPARVTVEVRGLSNANTVIGYVDVEPGQSAIQVGGDELQLRAIYVRGSKRLAFRSPDLPLETLRRIPTFRVSESK